MGGSGGGGSAGQVSYPTYMETKHSTWLDEIDTLIAAATNPFTSATAYDTDAALTANAAQVAIFNDVVVALNPDNDWLDFWTIAQNKFEADVFSDTLIEAKVAAFKANVLARLTQDILPVYQRGMQNVRAVMTSAFTIGEALITADAQRDVDRFEADLKRDNEQNKNNLISHSTDAMLASLNHKITANQSLATTTIESNRIKIVAKFEENEANVAFSEKEELWDFELYAFAGNVLASIGGAASATSGKKISTGQSVLGGATSGAAIGAQVTGTPMGAAVGGIIGGIGGLLAS